METAVKTTLSSIFNDGYKVTRHEGVVLFLTKERSNTFLWNTKDDEVIGSPEGYEYIEPFTGRTYFKVFCGSSRNSTRHQGVLNTKTGALTVQEENREITHLRKDYFSIKLESGAHIVLNAETGKVIRGQAEILGKYAIINGKEVVNLSTGDVVLSTDEPIEHLFGPYLLIGDTYKLGAEFTVFHFQAGKECKVPKVEGRRTSLKHIGSGKFLITYYGGNKRKHAILTFATGKVTEAS